jgi:hypothetical protein
MVGFINSVLSYGYLPALMRGQESHSPLELRVVLSSKNTISAFAITKVLFGIGLSVFLPNGFRPHLLKEATSKHLSALMVIQAGW